MQSELFQLLLAKVGKRSETPKLQPKIYIQLNIKLILVSMGVSQKRLKIRADYTERLSNSG